jgi:hypothetical protein
VDVVEVDEAFFVVGWVGTSVVSSYPSGVVASVGASTVVASLGST